MNGLAAYLAAWLFILGVSLGALAILMVHALVGGRWGAPLAAPLQAAVGLVPVVSLGFLPIALGLGALYPWVDDPGAGAHAAWWLQPGFFLARSVAYLVAWSLLAIAWRRPRTAAARRRLAAAGLGIHLVVVSLAAVDWIASLVPAWYSSGFGLVVGTGQMLGAMAFGVAVSAWRMRERADRGDRLIDLANLLLVFVLTWAYLAYTQFLVIWAGDLPRETAWYLPRMQTSWRHLGVFLVAFHFFVPLGLLLFRAAKRAPRRLAVIAAVVFAAHAADAWWLVVPSVSPRGFSASPVAVAIFLAVFVAWFMAWRRIGGTR